jgi:hypothetical protein
VRRERADQRVRWSKREKALLYGWEREKPTSMLIAGIFEGVTMGEINNYPGREKRPGDVRTFAQELDARGYDLTTLRFEIRRKATPTPPAPAGEGVK